MPVFNQSQKSLEHDISLRYSKRLLTTEMRYWLKKNPKKKSDWRTPCLLQQAVSLKKKNKMNFGLTPLCSELLCDNDSLLPTHTPALRAGVTASKPNTRVAGETHGRLDSSSLYRYMKYICGTPAILRAHSLAEQMLVEQCCRHQWRSSLEHWYSTSSSSPNWQMEIPGNETCENIPEGLIFSLRLSKSQRGKHAKTILTLNHNEVLNGRLDLEKASCKQRQPLVISVTSILSSLLGSTDTTGCPSQAPTSKSNTSIISCIWNQAVAMPDSTSPESLYPPETQGCK